MATTRLHDKFHRGNHWIYPSTVNPDQGRDPIASPRLGGFQGDFHLSGALSANCPLSAVAGTFVTAHTAISATGGELGIYASGLGGATIFSTSSSYYNLSGDLNLAGIYCFANTTDPGPFPDINYVRGYIPKALVVDGYSDFRFPMYAQSIYSPYIKAANIKIDNATVAILSAVSANFTSLTANTLTVTTIVTTTTATSTTTASAFSATFLSGSDIYGGYIHGLGHGVVAVRQTASSIIPQDTWTLVPLISAKWNPYNWFTAFGTISADKQGICLCEFTATAHSLTGTSLGIVAAVTTNTAITATADSDMDSLANPFVGTEYFTNNGVAFSTAAGVSGVTFQGTTLVSTNGTGERIGCYFYNDRGQTVVDYCRLRVIHLGLTN